MALACLEWEAMGCEKKGVPGARRFHPRKRIKGETY